MWTHLCPLQKVGTFGSDKSSSEGRSKWMLVDEKLGKEVDISAKFCIPVKARFMKRTVDADKEEWDVVDDDDINQGEGQKLVQSSSILCAVYPLPSQKTVRIKLVVGCSSPACGPRKLVTNRRAFPSEKRRVSPRKRNLATTPLQYNTNIVKKRRLV